MMFKNSVLGHFEYHKAENYDWININFQVFSWRKTYVCKNKTMPFMKSVQCTHQVKQTIYAFKKYEKKYSPIIA